VCELLVILFIKFKSKSNRGHIGQDALQ